jgi:hypothetical protein
MLSVGLEASWRAVEVLLEDRTCNEVVSGNAGFFNASQLL